MRLVLLIFLLFSFPLFAQDNSTRVPWLSSNLQGEPSPPKPYVAEVVWPELKFDKVTDICRLPSRNLMFLTQQKGKIWMLPDDLDTKNPEPKLFVDLAAELEVMESSFSIAFHPEFETNREVFVFYRIGIKGMEDGTRISRFRAFPDRMELDASTEDILLTFRAGGHNGGHLGFGPDGMLYILSGDSEVPSPPDPLNTGQDLTDLLSSVLRIDVDNKSDGENYSVPADNPFLKVADARPEIWAYGLRNPWKLCFHPTTGDLWVGDVGWELWEMLLRVEKGSNFGWSIAEGPQPIKVTQDMGPSLISPPTVYHPHTEFASITGGYVYEGDRLPELDGVYLYGDFVTGQLWGLWLNGSEVVKKEYLADTRLQIVTFGQAAKGEVVFMNWPSKQNIYRLVRNTQPDESAKFPRKLSETGVYSDVKKQSPADGVVPFHINGEMWHDGATAKRWVAVPGQETIEAKTGPFSKVPDGTVLAKTIERDGRKLETQILHFENLAWQGYSYRWNKDQTDAALVDAAGITEDIDGKPWTFHSRTDCVRCHNIGSDFRLAFHPGQLNRDGQLERFQEMGLINEVFVEKAEKEPAAQYDDKSAPIETRARTWLSANCAHCHRNRGGGSVTMKMDLETVLDKMDVIDDAPVKGGFGMDAPYLIAPGQAENSVVYYRSVTTGVGHMPMIGARTVDPKGEALLYEWITSMKPKGPDGKEDGKPFATLSSSLETMHRVRTGEMSLEEKNRLIEEGRQSPNPMIQGLFENLKVAAPEK